ncbi:protein arginine N-methyltransferase 1.6 [Tanacetum coccineum]
MMFIFKAIGIDICRIMRRMQFLALCEQEAGGSGSAPKRRTYIPREREEAEERLIDNYFGDDETLPKYSEEKFSAHPSYAIRQLAYDTVPDAFDEYLQLAERCSRQCLENFTKCIHVLYVEKFSRKPTSADIEKTYELHEEKHGLSRMLGSIDFMHSEWRNCPKFLHGQFKRKDDKHLTLMLEAVANQKFWICHAYFGVMEANNDLNMNAKKEDCHPEAALNAFTNPVHPFLM